MGKLLEILAGILDAALPKPAPQPIPIRVKQHPRRR